MFASMGKQPGLAGRPAASPRWRRAATAAITPRLSAILICRSPAMAGHSHAKNIMHRKAAQGAKKAQAFGKLIREISVSAKQGLPDPAMNPRLRAAVKA